MVLRWDLEHLLIKAGFHLTHTNKVSHIHNDNIHLWSGHLRRLGFDVQFHVGIPRALLLRQSKVALARRGSEVYWVSTRCCMMLLLKWQEQRKPASHQATAVAIAKLLLAKCFGSDQCDQLPLKQIPAQAAAKCTVDPTADGMCRCTRTCRDLS